MTISSQQDPHYKAISLYQGLTHSCIVLGTGFNITTVFTFERQMLPVIFFKGSTYLRIQSETERYTGLYYNVTVLVCHQIAFTLQFPMPNIPMQQNILLLLPY